MRRLILLRHAKTERESETGEDFDRALTDRGRSDAARVGQVLAVAGLIPDLALVSPALRTRQTWDEAAPFLPDARMTLAEGLYEAPPERVRRLAEAAQADTAMVVAHNPALHILAEELAGRALVSTAVRLQLADGLPTAWAAAFEFGDGRVGCLGLFNPRGPA